MLEYQKITDFNLNGLLSIFIKTIELAFLLMKW